MVLIAFGIRNSMRDKGLYLPTEGREIIFADTHLKISIGLLMEWARSHLGKNRQSYLEIPYSAIESIEFRAPLRRHKRMDVASYIKVIVRGMPNPVCFERNAFKGQEAMMLQAFRERVSVPIQAQDEIA